MSWLMIRANLYSPARRVTSSVDAGYQLRLQFADGQTVPTSSVFPAELMLAASDQDQVHPFSQDQVITNCRQARQIARQTPRHISFATAVQGPVSSGRSTMRRR